MARSSVKLKDLVVPNGTSVSNILKAIDAYGDAERILLTAEGAADGAITYTLEVTDDMEPVAGSPWRTFQILNGAALADFPVPNVNTKACEVPQGVLAATGFRIKSSANVTADRNFGVSKQYYDVEF